MNRKKNVKVTLLYPPNQSWPGTMCKPNGSLAYPNLGGALLEEDIEVEIFDACVGNVQDPLEKTFYQPSELPSGAIRTGVSDERILAEVESSNIVGITSIFTDQETMVLKTARLIKASYPDKLLIAGGVNARSRLSQFFTNGFDIVCLSEAERTILQIVHEASSGEGNWGNIAGIAYMSNGQIQINPSRHTDVEWNLDRLPMPAWHLLPNDRYWQIGRPHGGHFQPGETLRYGSMMTSLGCVFSCSYCHIAGETEETVSGPIGRFRIKSEDRVLAELEELKRLGVKQVFIEDDTLFGMKRRAISLLRKIQGSGVDILDVNGVNLIHLFTKYEPDVEVLEALVEAGFREIVLPFESGTQRIVSKYASNKWDVAKHNVIGLIKLCEQYGLTIAGNYMLGYPDESIDEINETLNMARQHMSQGLKSANFFLVMPLPGTPLFETSVQKGYLPRNFDPDNMHWTKANMINTLVNPQQLEEIRNNAWRELNNPDFVAYKTGMNVAETEL